MKTYADRIARLEAKVRELETDSAIRHGRATDLRASRTIPNSKPTLRDGEPCDHRGCLSHVSHPCDGCGRIAGLPIEILNPSLKTIDPKNNPRGNVSEI